MKILAHRGMWLSPEEQNTLQAFNYAFSANLGIEFDVRDNNGQLVVSHNMADQTAIKLEQVLAMHKHMARDVPLAINIKSDGLSHALKKMLDFFQTTHYFVFDMSLPDTFSWINAGVSSLVRHSEYEPVTEISERAQGIWFDCFSPQPPAVDLIKDCLEQGKIACIVSEELHLRPYYDQWHALMMLPEKYLHSDRLMLCTDYPIKARDIFNV